MLNLSNNRMSSDKEIIDRALSGDQRAYSDLVNKYRDLIFNLIYRMIGNREEAEDLVQEVFIKAFTALSTFNEQYAFSTWLYKIAVNHCIDALRKKKLRTLPLDKPISFKDKELKREYPDLSPGPEGKLLSEERAEIVQKAIHSLPEKYRTVILLRHTEEKSYEEISAILNIPLGTVKARLFRARELLKKKLKRLL